MSSTENRQVPSFTFRLYQSIRFNRPVNKEKDIVSPGGYELKMKDEDGTEKTVKFDFEDYEGSVEDDDPCIVTCVQKNPDYVTFKDLDKVTKHMLCNVTEAVEWFIFTGEPDEDNPLIPVEIIEPVIEIISNDERTFHTITVPVKPASNFSDEA